MNHQPLLKAGNPSRRERVGNYWVRQRRRLTRAGLIGAGVLIFSVLLARPVYDWPAPPEPSHSEFQSAVTDVEDGERSRSTVEKLQKIVEKYPRSCLARFYLAFALKGDRKKEYDAKRYLREALAVAGVDETVLRWAEQHPEFCPQLVDFVEAGINRADEFAQKYDKDDPEREEALDSELRKPGYDLFSHALQLAQMLNPASPKIQHLFAKIELMFGNYEESYHRLSTVLDSLSKKSDSNAALLFFCRHLRGRVAFLWVERQRTEGVEFGVNTVALLKTALKDLKICSNYLPSNHFSEGHELKEYRVVHDQVRANLTLAEVEIDMQDMSGAAKRLKVSSDLMEILDVKAQFAGVELSAIASLKRRLEEATKRHKGAERSTGGMPIESPVAGCDRRPP